MKISNENGVEFVTITREEYQALLKDQIFLQCLQNAGVDNWEGYSDAIQLMEEEYYQERIYGCA